MEENYQLVSLNKIAGLVFINENNEQLTETELLNNFKE